MIAKPNTQAMGPIAGWAATAGIAALAIDALTSALAPLGPTEMPFSPGSVIAAGSACIITALALWRNRHSFTKGVLDPAMVTAASGSGHEATGLPFGLSLSRDPAQQDALEAELYRQITTDPLTQIANRRHFIARLEETIAQTQREPDRHIALITFSLHGELFDDLRWSEPSSTPGTAELITLPAAQQDGLRRLAQRCRESLRPGDVICRLEGARFAVLLPNAKPRAAMACAERLRNAMDRFPLTDDGITPMPYYAAFGVATLKGGETGGELIERCIQAEATARQRQDMMLFASNAPPLREALSGGLI